MKRLALVLLLVAGVLAHGQDAALQIKGDIVVIDIDEVVIVKKKRALARTLPFTLTATPGAADYRWTIPPNVLAIESDEGTLKVTSAPKGECTFSCRLLVVDFNAKVTKRTTESLTLNIGDVVPPLPPTPPLPPIPPPPTPTPLQQSLQAAYNLEADTDKASKVAALADLLGNVVSYAQGNGTIKTAPALATYVHTMAEQHKGIGPGAIPKTRAAVGTYLNSVLPRTGATDSAYWAKASSEYGYVALALKGVK
jgi:hypothetical protein